jgi:hypothetical protein
MLITKNNIFHFKKITIGLIEVIIALLLHNEMNINTYSPMRRVNA